MKRAYILALSFILTWLSLTIVQFKTLRFSPVTPPLSLKINPKIYQFYPVNQHLCLSALRSGFLK